MSQWDSMKEQPSEKLSPWPLLPSPPNSRAIALSRNSLRSFQNLGRSPLLAFCFSVGDMAVRTC